MPMEQVTVSVADDYYERFSEVVERSERAGLEVEEQLTSAGVVTGTIDSAKRADLERVEGVAAVEVSRAFQLPPPDSDVQ